MRRRATTLRTILANWRSVDALSNRYVRRGAIRFTQPRTSFRQRRSGTAWAWREATATSRTDGGQFDPPKVTYSNGSGPQVIKTVKYYAPDIDSFVYDYCSVYDKCRIAKCKVYFYYKQWGQQLVSDGGTNVQSDSGLFLYWKHWLDPDVIPSLQQLKQIGARRIRLKPGRTVSISFRPKVSKLAMYKQFPPDDLGAAGLVIKYGAMPFLHFSTLQSLIDAGGENSLACNIPPNSGAPPYPTPPDAIVTHPDFKVFFGGLVWCLDGLQKPDQVDVWWAAAVKLIANK